MNATPFVTASIICLICTIPATVPGAETSEPVTIGDTLVIESRILNEQRTILVSTPAGYDTTSAEYPVLYVLDGEDTFHLVSGIVRFLSLGDVIPDMIVVGIVNTDRRRDLLPNVQHADQFLSFIKTELIPAIDTSYRTEPYRVLAGHSWGGIFTMYTFITEPLMMHAYIASSPWLNGNMRVLCDEASTFVENHSSLDRWVYLTVGNEPDFLPGIGLFAQAFTDHQVDNLEWHFNQLPAENHETIMLPTLFKGLRTLYRNWTPIPE